MQVTPEQELVFQKTSQQHPKQTLSIKNTLQDYLAFKVKTTAPKQFVVRPNSGRLSPGESVEVSIVLQARESADFNRKDKFLVQSIKVPLQYQTLDDKSFNDKVGELWSHAEMIKKNSPESEVVLEKKLRCLYSLTEQSTPETQRARAGTTNSNDEFGESPQFGSANMLVKDEGNYQFRWLLHITIINITALFKCNINLTFLDSKIIAPTVVSPDKTAIPATDKTLQKENKDLKDRISLLTSANEGYKKELERINNIRQRKAETTAPPTSSYTAPTQKATKGPNLQYLAILCLVSFLLGAWLF